MSTWERECDATVAVAQTVDELVQRHLVVVVRVHLLKHLLHVKTSLHSHLHVLRVGVRCGRHRLRDATRYKRGQAELVNVIDNILSRLHHKLELLERDVSLSLRVNHTERKGLDIRNNQQTNEFLLGCASRQNAQASDVVLKRDFVVAIGAERVEQQICENRLCCLAQKTQRFTELESTLLNTINTKRVQTFLVLRVGLEVVQIVLQILLCKSSFRLHVRLLPKPHTDSAERLISLGIFGFFEYWQCKCGQSYKSSMNEHRNRRNSGILPEIPSNSAIQP